ncbi:TPA: PFL_4669 family integrating conjugative element protein [Salmonella enterica]
MKENTENAQSDDIGKKKELRSGALRSSLKVELHTRYAILLWEGQFTEKTEKSGRKVSHRRIMGMPYFLHLVSRINDDSLKDDPFADKKMFLLEEEFNRGTEVLETLCQKLDLVLKDIPPRVSLSEALSVSPVNISVFSRTPVGYRGVWLLVGFDQLALKAFQASHYGLISHAERDDYLRRGAQSIHRLYGLVLGYRSSGVTRRDFALENSQYHEAIKHAGEIEDAILLGKKRSSFSPPVSLESIELLLAANEKADKADIVQLPEDPPESVIDPSLFTSDSKHIDD